MPSRPTAGHEDRPSAGCPGVDVAPPQRLPQPLEDEEGVGGAIQPSVRAEDAHSPGTCGQPERYLVRAGRPAALQGTQRLPGAAFR